MLAPESYENGPSGVGALRVRNEDGASLLVAVKLIVTIEPDVLMSLICGAGGVGDPWRRIR